MQSTERHKRETATQARSRSRKAALSNWLQLFRLQTSGLTAAMLVVTRWVAAGVDLADTIVLIVAGLTLHAGGFGLNEWADRAVDGDNPHKVNPVTDGGIQPWLALEVSKFLIMFSFGALVWWSLGIELELLVGIPLLLLSYGLGTYYDLHSKETRWSPFILAGWAGTLSLWVVGVSGWSVRALWLPPTWSFMLLVQCGQGIVKDWEYELSRWTVPQVNGLMLVGQICFVAVVSCGWFLLEDPGGGATVVLGIMMVVAVALGVEVISRGRSKGGLVWMGAHNIVEYTTILWACSLWIGPVPLAAALIVPVVIYVVVNRLAYGRASAPSI